MLAKHSLNQMACDDLNKRSLVGNESSFVPIFRGSHNLMKPENQSRNEQMSCLAIASKNSFVKNRGYGFFLLLNLVCENQCKYETFQVFSIT